MNIDDIRDYCLSKKHSSESFPFDNDTLVFKVLNKMFERMADEMPLRAMELFSGGGLKRRQVEILLALLNWQPITALRLYLRRGD